jgi:hypothetical protein
MGISLFGDRSRNDYCAPGAQFRFCDRFLVGHILVMMSLCRIILSFIGYIVGGDIGVFPLRGSFSLCHLTLALVVSMSS